jgi:PASTA domain
MRQIKFSNFFGGTTTRLESYGLFLLAMIFVSGSVGGAIVYTNLASAKAKNPAVATPAISATPEKKVKPSASAKENQPKVSPTPKPTENSPEATEPKETKKPKPTPTPTTTDLSAGGIVQLPGYLGDSSFYVPPGVPMVVAPNVIGWTYDQVRDWTRANLNRNPAWTDTNCFGSQYPPGTVAMQNPQPGSLIPNDFNPLTTGASTTGLAIWMERDSYVGTNWYSEGPCVYQ